MGHAYWNILNDVIARYNRMKGFNVLLPQGWDCQGLPTKLKVQNRWKIPKDDKEYFRQKCVEWTNQMISSMKKTMIKLGYRPDWEQFEYRTMDKSYWHKVQTTLLQFFDKGLIYRDVFPVHWCPHCETALAQAELGYIEEKASLHYIQFKHDKGSVEVATTRPELLLACQALMVHPEDDRHLHLRGKSVEVPLSKNRVPVLIDDDVDPEYGSGVVMVCTFGDEQDIKWQQKYNLPISRIIDESGHLTNVGKYSGLSVDETRQVIVHDLEKEGSITKRQDILHKVLSHTERSDCLSPIEFLIKTQFFIKIKDFKQDVIEACREMEWLPDYMFQRLIDWVTSIEWDWLISRQRLYGTPLPFWFCDNCNIIIPAREDQLPVDPTKVDPPTNRCPKCNSTQVEASEDVCDCWVDSSITPLIISGYFYNKDHFTQAYPTNIRQQGHDIIRTWLYYSTFRCLILTGTKPFKEVLINGHILGPDGHRMSKSRGNVINPEDKIGKYGIDSLRLGLLSVTLGSDFSFNWEIVKYCKGFLQKYWSALRFGHMFIKGYTPTSEDSEHLTTIDKWILFRLRETLEKVTMNINKYQFHSALNALQNFFWHDVCDQYLEAVKYRLYNNDDASAKYTLYTVLWNSTLSLAPFCPHITEEVYHTLWFDEKKLTIHELKWPDSNRIPSNEEAKKSGEIVIEVLTKIRSEKAKKGISLKQDIDKISIMGDSEQLSIIKESESDIKHILHVNHIQYEDSEEIAIRID